MTDRPEAEGAAASAELNVVVYTKSRCAQCVATMRALDRAGITYGKVNVEENEQALEDIKARGFRQMPVVTCGDAAWAGFQPDRIAGLKSILAA